MPFFSYPALALIPQRIIYTQTQGVQILASSPGNVAISRLHKTLTEGFIAFSTSIKLPNATKMSLSGRRYYWLSLPPRRMRKRAKNGRVIASDVRCQPFAEMVESVAADGAVMLINLLARRKECVQMMQGTSQNDGVRVPGTKPIPLGTPTPQSMKSEVHKRSQKLRRWGIRHPK